MTEPRLTACCWSTVSRAADEIAAVTDEVRVAHPDAALVVSCQRTEAYSDHPCDCRAPVRFEGVAAVRHLAEVAAGLHAVVLGEAEILGQVRTGLTMAPSKVRPVMDVAVAAARDLRRHTRFNSHAGALLDRGLLVAGVAPAGRLLVLGTGQLGRLVATRAQRFPFEEVILAGRAEPSPMPRGARFVPLDAIAELGPVQVIAGCLGAGAPEVALDSLPRAELLLDLGTPRNFAPGIIVPVVTLASMLADEASRPHAVRRRRELAARLAATVDAGLAALAADRTSAAGSIRAAAEQVRRQELARVARLHPELPAEAADALTRALVNQLLHLPTRRLQDADPAFAAQVASLFAPAP